MKLLISEYNRPPLGLLYSLLPLPFSSSSCKVDSNSTVFLFLVCKLLNKYIKILIHKGKGWVQYTPIIYITRAAIRNLQTPFREENAEVLLAVYVIPNPFTQGLCHSVGYSDYHIFKWKMVKYFESITFSTSAWISTSPGAF